MKKYFVRVSENSIGEVMGELNRRGAWLENYSNTDGVATVEATISSDEMTEFQDWLKNISAGTGSVEVIS